MSLLINHTSLGSFIIVTGSFVLLLVLLRLFAWDNITAIFKEREDKIAAELDASNRLQDEAKQLAKKRQEELKKAQDEAGAILVAAKEAGQEKERQLISQAEETAQQMTQRANLAIAQKERDAAQQVQSDLAQMSLLLTEKLLSHNLDETAQSELIDRYIKELGEV